MLQLVSHRKIVVEIRPIMSAKGPIVSEVTIDNDGESAGIHVRHGIAQSLVQPVLDSTNLDEVIVSAHSCAASLVRLGIAKSCNVVIDSNEPGKVSVILKPERLSRILAKTGTHIGASEGSMTATLSLRNMFGGGETLEANAGYGMETSVPLTSDEIYAADVGKTFQMHLSAPVMMDPDTKLELSAQNVSKDHTSTQSHVENAMGATLKYKLLNRVSGDHEIALDVSMREIANLHDKCSWGLVFYFSYSILHSILIILFSAVSDKMQDII